MTAMTLQVYTDIILCCVTALLSVKLPNHIPYEGSSKYWANKNMGLFVHYTWINMITKLSHFILIRGTFNKMFAKCSNPVTFDHKVSIMRIIINSVSLFDTCDVMSRDLEATTQTFVRGLSILFCFKRA